MFNLEISEQVSNFAIHTTTFITLFLNGLTNLPSSQFVYLTLGYLINVKSFNFYIAILIGAIANTLGNLVLYYIILHNSDFLNSKLAKFLSMDKEKIVEYNLYFKNRWWGWLILGKITPSLKVLVPVICGLSKISFKKTLTIFFIGSLLWGSIVTYLGYYFGKQASLLEFYIIVTCVYIVIGILSYIRIKLKKNKDKINKNISN